MDAAQIEVLLEASDHGSRVAIGDLLAHDPEDLVQKAVGAWAAKPASETRHACSSSPIDTPARCRTALRDTIERLDPEARRHYLQSR